MCLTQQIVIMSTSNDDTGSNANALINTSNIVEFLSSFSLLISIGKLLKVGISL